MQKTISDFKELMSLIFAYGLRSYYAYDKYATIKL